MKSLRFWCKTIFLVVAVCFLSTAIAWAGSPKKHKHKKEGFFHKIGKKIVHAGDHIVNGVMDTGVKAKQKITGKKKKVWVCGHYDKNGNHVKGHWRYLKHGNGGPGQGNPGQGNDPGQGGQPGQGDPGQGGNQPPAPPAPPEEPPAPPAPPEEQPAPPEEQPAPPEEQPAPPAEPGQGDQGNQGQTGGKKTLGGLMSDLVSLSDDLDQVKMQVLKVKKGHTKAVKNMSTDEDFQNISVEREHDANLLFKVISQDLEKNNGKSGIYYSAYLRNMKKLSKADCKNISDVSKRIETFVRHNANGSHKNEYKKRLDEVKKF